MQSKAGPTPGRLVRDARVLAGLTQRMLAELAGTTQPAISRLERDRHSPSIETLNRLLGLTGHSLELGLSPSAEPAHSSAKTLLQPGNPAWAGLEAEKRRALRPNRQTSVEDLLRRGISLSRQAAALRRAVSDG